MEGGKVDIERQQRFWLKREHDTKSEVTRSPTLGAFSRLRTISTPTFDIGSSPHSLDHAAKQARLFLLNGSVSMNKHLDRRHIYGGPIAKLKRIRTRLFE